MTRKIRKGFDRGFESCFFVGRLDVDVSTCISDQRKFVVFGLWRVVSGCLCSILPVTPR